MYYKVKEETIKDISNAIRTKSGASGEIQVKDFAQAILDLETNENTVAAEKSAIAAAGSAVSAESSAKAASESAGAAASSFDEVVEKVVEAKASADIAEEHKDSAALSAASAAESETNAKYWYEQAFNIAQIEAMTEDEVQTIWDDVFNQGVSE